MSDAAAIALDLGSRTLLLGKTLPLIKYFCSILKKENNIPWALLQDFKQAKSNEKSSVLTAWHPTVKC